MFGTEPNGYELSIPPNLYRSVSSGPHILKTPPPQNNFNARISARRPCQQKEYVWAIIRASGAHRSVLGAPHYVFPERLTTRRGRVGARATRNRKFHLFVWIYATTTWIATHHSDSGQQLAVAEATVPLPRATTRVPDRPKVHGVPLCRVRLPRVRRSSIDPVGRRPAVFTTATQDELDQVFTNKNPQIMKWVLTTRPAYKTEIATHHLRAMIHQSQDDRLPLFQWLEANVANLPYNASVMDEAAAMGDLDLVQYLHAHRTEECTSKAMDNAVRNGHLHVVRFLHENRAEGCTSNAMDFAAKESHLDMVRFLHENRTEGCTTNAMDWAAAAGHLEVVRFLHDHRTEECTVQAVDEAGNLQVVRFLLENRTEGCTENAMDHAATWQIGYRALSP